MIKQTTQIFCNGCGMEIKHSPFHIGKNEDGYSVDFCEDCWKSFSRWLEERRDFGFLDRASKEQDHSQKLKMDTYCEMRRKVATEYKLGYITVTKMFDWLNYHCGKCEFRGDIPNCPWHHMFNGMGREEENEAEAEKGDVSD